MVYAYKNLWEYMNVILYRIYIYRITLFALLLFAVIEYNQNLYVYRHIYVVYIHTHIYITIYNYMDIWINICIMNINRLTTSIE